MTELLDCYLPVFKLVQNITGDPTVNSDYEMARQQCINQLEQAFVHASQLDVNEKEKEAACFAVIAWLDETVLCSTLPWRSRWLCELLQRKYLNTTIAGERFFTELAQLTPADRQARCVFLFCLQNGFHGQYSSPEAQPALQSIIGDLRSEVLPDVWQSWPNEAPIIPSSFSKPVTKRLTRSPLLSMLAVLTLLYGMLFFFLYHYKG